jgi:hypothetical protein
MYQSNNACCRYMAWARPHLLVFLDYPLVESLDPTTRKVTLLGDLNDAVVAPNGGWVAGSGTAGPDDPVASTVYVSRWVLESALSCPELPRPLQASRATAKR